MNRIFSDKRFTALLCFIIIAATLLMGGCEKNEITAPEPTVTTSAPVTTEAKPKDIGKGKIQFLFTVTDAEGNETQFNVHTNKATVGQALLDCGLIAGEITDYGVYVKIVNGIRADYQQDGHYWAFYVNNDYAPTGVDKTVIKSGDIYSFRVQE